LLEMQIRHVRISRWRPETIHLLTSLAEVTREGKQAERYLQCPQIAVRPADKIPSARPCHGLTTACSSRIRNWRRMLECGYRVLEPRWPFYRRRNGRCVQSVADRPRAARTSTPGRHG